ncbi:MAG: SUMF1/EgtB/PvdO family nonheme iron enzyme [Chthoniobacterales bacterium]|nr:SUMF1/EgtB/PvdO family nonheme iron enzyme [Chthoniobacterales bacterium]
MLTISPSRLISSFSLPSLCAALVSFLCTSALATEPPSKQSPSKLSPSGTQMVLIGDAWNRADEWGHGFCSKNFYLGAFEWTVRDWKEKVLDLAACKIDVNNNDPALRIADPHGLWNKGMERWITRRETTPGEYAYSIVKGAEYLPITNVNLFDTLRACNIIQRVKEYGPSLGLEEGESFDEVTERGGAYFITTVITPEGKKKQEAYQAVGYCFYIPTQNEWIKAGHYTPHYNPNKIGDANAPAGYYLYPTQHDINPRNKWDQCLENRANYIADSRAWFFLFNPPLLELSEVNHCGWLELLDKKWMAQGTHSYYGCFDMAGNVNEWTTTRVKLDRKGNRTEMNNEGMITSGDEHGNYFYPVRGGDYESAYYMEQGVDNYLMRTCSPELFDPTTQNDRIGFRMAAVERAVTPIGEGYAEKDHYNRWWDTLTTGQQEVVNAISSIGLAIIPNIGFAIIDDLTEGALTAALITRGGSKAITTEIDADTVVNTANNIEDGNPFSTSSPSQKGPTDHKVSDLIPDDNAPSSVINTEEQFSTKDETKIESTTSQGQSKAGSKIFSSKKAEKKRVDLREDLKNLKIREESNPGSVTTEDLDNLTIQQTKLRKNLEKKLNNLTKEEESEQPEIKKVLSKLKTDRDESEKLKNQVAEKSRFDARKE